MGFCAQESVQQCANLSTNQTPMGMGSRSCRDPREEWLGVQGLSEQWSVGGNYATWPSRYANPTEHCPIHVARCPLFSNAVVKVLAIRSKHRAYH